MPDLDPAVALVLADMADLPPYEAMSPSAARAANAERNRFWNELPPEVASVRTVTVPGPRRELGGRLYRPLRSCCQGGVLFLHGGGWLFGSSGTHDALARRLANAAGAPLLSLDYGLAPEEPFPCGLEDCRAGLRWLRRELGTDRPNPPIAIAGDSAGANLALATCLAERDAGLAQPCAAALIYGAYSGDLDGPSVAAFGDGRHVLSGRAMAWFWNHYLQREGDRHDPLAVPLHARLAGLPPLHIIAAELDPLRDDSERLARRLIEAGVPFNYRLWRGMTHAAINWSRRVPGVEPMIFEIAAFLASQLRRAEAEASLGMTAPPANRNEGTG